EQPLQQNHAFQTSPKIVYNLDDNTGNQPNNEVEKKTIVQTQPSNNVENNQFTAQTQQETPQNAVKTVDIRDIEVVEPKFVIVKPKQVVSQTIAAEQFTFDLLQQETEFEAEESEFSFEIQQPLQTTN